MRARLKNDFELEEFSFKSRTAEEGWPGLPSTPETVQLKAANVDGERVHLTGKRTVILQEHHRQLLKRLNSEPAYRYIIEPKAGWFNTGEWKAESIGFGDNLVEVLQIIGKYARIQTLDYYQSDLSYLFFSTHPYLIHRMAVVTRKGTLIRPGRGLDVYIFLISKVPLWLPVRRLDFHRLTPVSPIGFSDVIVIRAPWTKIRQRPSYLAPMNYRAWLGSRWQVSYIQNGWGCTVRGWIDLRECIAA